MGRPTTRKSGVPFTQVERNRRAKAKKAARLKAQQKAAQQTRRVDANGPLGILPLAIADVAEADLASNSVDLVLSDPPYAEADIPLYGELGRFAMRVLAPSSLCLVMAGDIYLDRVMALMTASGLLYHSFVFVSFPGGHHSRIRSTKTFQAGKLVLLFQKPPRSSVPAEWGPNIIAAPKNGHDKSLHPWQQSQPAFEALIERFTLEQALVADPFAGSGACLRAALALGRSAWGADIAA